MLAFFADQHEAVGPRSVGRAGRPDVVLPRLLGEPPPLLTRAPTWHTHGDRYGPIGRRRSDASRRHPRSDARRGLLGRHQPVDPILEQGSGADLGIRRGGGPRNAVLGQPPHARQRRGRAALSHGLSSRGDDRGRRPAGGRRLHAPQGRPPGPGSRSDRATVRLDGQGRRSDRGLLRQLGLFGDAGGVRAGQEAGAVRPADRRWQPAIR